MFPMDMETTVPCAPMGTAAIRMATKIASNRKNRSLNAAVTQGGQDDNTIRDSKIVRIA